MNYIWQQNENLCTAICLITYLVQAIGYITITSNTEENAYLNSNTVIQCSGKKF